MKRLLTIICVLLLVLCFAPVFASDLHKVELGSIVPFSISNEFPQILEKGAFQFKGVASGELGSMRYVLIVAQSNHDPNYSILLLSVTLDDMKTIHIVGAMSGSLKGSEPKNLKVYKDEVFFKTGKPSGVLTSCSNLPGPDDLEKVAPPAKVKLKNI